MPSYWVDPTLSAEQVERGNTLAARSPYSVMGIFRTQYILPHDVGIWVFRSLGTDPLGCIGGFLYAVAGNPQGIEGTIDYFMGECGTPVYRPTGGYRLSGNGSIYGYGYEGTRISGGGTLRAVKMSFGVNSHYMGPFTLDHGIIIGKVVTLSAAIARHNAPAPMPIAATSSGRPIVGQIYPR